MDDELIRLRRQSERARELANLTTDALAISGLRAYAEECEARALDLEAEREAQTGLLGKPDAAQDMTPPAREGVGEASAERRSADHLRIRLGTVG